MQYRFAKLSGLMEDMKLIRQNGFGKILRNCFPFISSNPTSGKNIRGGNSSCQHEWLKVSLVDEHTPEREHNWSLRGKIILPKCSWFKPKKIAALHVDIFGMSRRRCQFVLKIFFCTFAEFTPIRYALRHMMLRKILYGLHWRDEMLCREKNNPQKETYKSLFPAWEYMWG